jgi:pyruvate dehydrogenase E1 component
VVVGTPAGVTLAPEGGAHQSTITPSIGMELPGLTYAEPCFARALDWVLCDGLRRLGEPDGDSLYLRLSTRPVDQSPFEAVVADRGADAVRHDVLRGGHRLAGPPPELGDAPAVVIAACGAVVPEAVHAARALAHEGIAATVLDLVSPDRLFREWRSALRSAASSARRARLADVHLGALLPPELRRAPIVTVHDAASHSLAWLGSVFGQRVLPVGVDEFGQSGSIADLYGHFDLLPDQIASAAMVAIELDDAP